MSVGITEIAAILAPLLGMGVALAALIIRGTNRLETHIKGYASRADADRRSHQSSMEGYASRAADDRRAFQSGMDDFRREMQRLAERQSHVEDERAASPAE